MAKPNKETLVLYIIDYGVDNAYQIFNINEKIADEIINPKFDSRKYSYNTVINKLLSKNAPLILNIIALHFNQLKKEYSINKRCISLSQTDEDYFLKAIIRCAEIGLDNVTELNVFNLLKIQFATIKHYGKLQAYQMRANLTPYEIKNKDGDSFIPSDQTEYTSNASNF